MKRQVAWSLLLVSFFSLAGRIELQSQEGQASQPSTAKEQPAAGIDGPSLDEPGLMLASAYRVYLDAELGEIVQPGFGRYSSHPSGRGAPSAQRAHAELQKAIAQWG